MVLTEVSIRAAKPRERLYRLSDERGLALEVTPSGGRLWRFRYRFNGIAKMISLGAYPDVSLKQARERRDEARKRVADGADPSAERKAARETRADTLSVLAEEFFRKEETHLAGTTVAASRERFTKWLAPQLGKRPIASITAPELLAALRRIEAHGKNETAHRAKSIFSRIARHAIAEGRGGLERDVSADLRGALVPKQTENHAALTEPLKVGELLRAIDAYQGQPSVLYALRLAPLVFVRPGELRGARWSEIEDLDGAEPTWRIPAERMKMREEHLVPLSAQAVAILRDLQSLTGNGELLFPSLRTRSRPISDGTLTAALRRLGYKGDEQTAHGFRSIASTLLNEQGFPPDVIELQLAHAERNKVRAAYNKAKRLPERRAMMQQWGTYLDALKIGAKIIPIRSGAGR